MLPVGWTGSKALVPLKHELQRLHPSSFDFKVGESQAVHRWLADGTVALAPCSTICLLREPSHEIAFPLGVVSEGSVSSMYLGLQGDPSTLMQEIHARNRELRAVFSQAEILFEKDARQAAQFIWQMARERVRERSFVPPVLQISASASGSSSVMLARIMFRLWFGDEAYQSCVPVNDTTPAHYDSPTRSSLRLIVGDEALMKRNGFTAVLHLEQIWKQLTGLPFVFSVWQFASTPVGHVWRKKIMEAAELAQARMQVEPVTYIQDLSLSSMNGSSPENGYRVNLTDYWKGIQYRLQPSHLKSMILFLCLARYLPSAQVHESAIIKITRWQQLSSGPGRSQTY